MMNAPAPYPIPTVSPYAAGLAAQEAAKQMGWRIVPPVLPKPVYMPVVMYRRPVDYVGSPLPNPLKFQPSFVERMKKMRKLKFNKKPKPVKNLNIVKSY